VRLDCAECSQAIEADEVEALGEALLLHARADHEWPYPDQAIRNFAEATQRLTGGAERLPAIGAVTVHPVTEERLDDWLAFFDHDAFVGTPEWAACYCLEPHVGTPDTTDASTASADHPHWRENREAMAARLRAGGAYGYLAYVDGKPSGWVNASKRSDYTLYRFDTDGTPPGVDVIGVSCFIIAPPYRRHGVAEALLDRVLDDAATRGATWVEAYPFNEVRPSDSANFRGPLSMYEARGFEAVEQQPNHTVVRRRA
jgi:GNAT superfamily N-acetyltransferase